MECIRIKLNVSKVTKKTDGFIVIFGNNSELLEKYRTEYGSFVAMGYGDIEEGDTCILLGDWQFNSRRNSWCFQFCCAEKEIPTNDQGLIAYLQSDVFKGIGKTIAKRIVSKFKEKTLDIIEQTPERLKEIVGIGDKKYSEMMSNYSSSQSFKSLVMTLSPPPINMSSRMIRKVIKILGKNALYQIESNPYILCEKVSGISFHVADFIALEKYNWKKDSVERYRACAVYVLKTAATIDGHTFLPLKDLYVEFSKLIQGVSVNDFVAMLKVYRSISFDFDVPKDNFGTTAIYLSKFFEMENSIAQTIKTLNSSVETDTVDFRGIIATIEAKLGISYDDSQLHAIEELDKSNFYVITGGPGTGKSTIIKGIIESLKVLNENCVINLCAPTGRAAKRLTETTGRYATTIHTLLEFSGIDGFTKNKSDRLSSDVVIVDESSMIDMPLMNALLDAVRDKAKVILVGDIDQLPPVGVGYVLRDLIDSSVVPIIRLTTTFRQAEGSLIKLNARKINCGDTLLEYSNDFTFTQETTQDLLLTKIVSSFIDSLEKYNGTREEALYNIQILSPQKKGSLGVNRLNTLIQNELCPSVKNQIVFTNKINNNSFEEIYFRVGDKVIQTVNDYEKNVFNGDLGIIVDILESDDSSEKVIKIKFENTCSVKEYKEFELRDNISLAYAITIHKSQGSEYYKALVICHSSHAYMNQRNLLYTGVSRAKINVDIFGDEKAVEKSIKTVRSVFRHTGLTDRLKKIHNTTMNL